MELNDHRHLLLTYVFWNGFLFFTLTRTCFFQGLATTSLRRFLPRGHEAHCFRFPTIRYQRYFPTTSACRFFARRHRSSLRGPMFWAPKRPTLVVGLHEQLVRLVGPTFFLGFHVVRPGNELCELPLLLPPLFWDPAATKWKSSCSKDLTNCSCSHAHQTEKGWQLHRQVG